MKKKLIMLLAVILSLSSVNAGATTITKSGGAASSAVSLTADPYDMGIDSDANNVVALRRFSVTVPMQLPIRLLSDNTAISASNARIVNNSSESVKVTEVELITYNGFTLDDYNKVYSIVDLNSRKFGMSINGDIFSSATKELSLTDKGWEDIPSKGYLNLTYNTNFAPTTESIKDMDIAEVVFTVSFKN